MDHGLYTAYLGMRARQRALDVMSNNIANASTPGFKAERMLYRSVEAAEKEAGVSFSLPGETSGTTETVNNQTIDRSLASTHGYNVGVVARTTGNYTAGMIRQTGQKLDVALEGDGFLAIQTPRGERYTRAGALRLNTENQIVTPQGDLVAGENGPITLPAGEAVIGDYGDVSVNGQVIDRLKLVRFDDAKAALIKEGDSLFVAPNAQAQAATTTRIVQGALESSNVDPITEMAAMMQNSREFDSLQRSITMLMNDLGRKVASEIGRL
jgi:flagellar basal-body rod protein FlgF